MTKKARQSTEDGVGGDNEISPVQPPRNRPKNNVSRACATCRRKRTRCDGRPRCLTCQLHDLECVYDRETDGRRPAHKQYVEALENRVKQLERQLQSPDRDTEDGSAGEESAGPDQIGLLGVIRISDAGSVAHYGPTSAYMHVQDAATETSEKEAGSVSDKRRRLVQVDWPKVPYQRFLAPVTLSPHAHLRLLCSFFSHLNTWCQWTDQGAFTADLLTASTDPTASSRTAHYSPFLHNIILALALLNSSKLWPSIEGDAREISRALATHAASMMEAELSRPMTTTARGLMLLGSYNFHNLNRNLGWLYASLGVRTGQLLGLNIDCSDLVDNRLMSSGTRQHRNQTFWTIYIQDILWTFNVGRTPTFSFEDFKTDLPAISESEDEEPWEDEEQRLMPTCIASRPGWRSSCFHWTARLAMIGGDIHKHFYRVRQAPHHHLAQISKLELDLEQWHVELASPLRIDAWQGERIPPHIVNMHAVFNYLRILLHRPTTFKYVGMSSEDRRSSAAVCEAAARELMRLLERYPSVCHATTTVPNIVFTAGTAFLLVAASNEATPSSVKEALERVDQCIRFFENMSWPAASVGRDILARMKDEWNPPAQVVQPAVGLAQLIESDPTALKALEDPSSSVVKLLTSMGWQPPEALQPAARRTGAPSVPPPAPSVALDGIEGGDALSFNGLFPEQGTSSLFDPFTSWTLGQQDFNLNLPDFDFSNLGGSF